MRLDVRSFYICNFAICFQFSVTRFIPPQSYVPRYKENIVLLNDNGWEKSEDTSPYTLAFCMLVYFLEV